jgi:hypothetical protein
MDQNLGTPAEAIIRMKALLLLAIIVSAPIHAQTSPGNSLCSDVTMFYNHPLADLPIETQRLIRKAVEPSIVAVANEQAMDIKPADASLYAIEISRHESSRKLYAVSWTNPLFGVNAPIWIVEVEAGHASQIQLGPIPGNKEGWLSGWGVEVLPPLDKPFPDLMFASKGYHAGGGAEAEAVCVARQGSEYTEISCPPGCFDRLNAR